MDLQLLKQTDIFTAGGNNKVYKVQEGTKTFALKKYKDDKRGRLNAEWAFLKALPEAPVPKAIAIDAEAGLGLYSFIEGEKIKNIGDTHIQQAQDFIRLINAPAARKACAELHIAAEAQFSVQGHYDALDSRLQRIKHIPELKDFSSQLEKTAARWHRSAEHKLKTLKIKTADKLKRPEWVLSPSDFGFHNALEKDGKLTFIDFEYAGWDDPAKLVSDFFYQPEMPVPEKYYEGFVQAALSHIEDKEWHSARIDALRPGFGLKWCCIILNPFNQDYKPREGDDLEKLRGVRLNAAQELLKRLGI